MPSSLCLNTSIRTTRSHTRTCGREGAANDPNTAAGMSVGHVCAASLAQQPPAGARGKRFEGLPRDAKQLGGGGGRRGIAPSLAGYFFRAPWAGSPSCSTVCVRPDGLPASPVQPLFECFTDLFLRSPMVCWGPSSGITFPICTRTLARSVDHFSRGSSAPPSTAAATSSACGVTFMRGCAAWTCLGLVESNVAMPASTSTLHGCTSARVDPITVAPLPSFHGILWPIHPCPPMRLRRL
jgi:hypothetical protein